MNFVSDETMSCHQLAAYTGKNQREIFFDISTLMDEMTSPEEEDGITFVNIATKRVEVRLNKMMTYRLIMRYTQAQQDIVRFAWGDFKIPAAPSLKAKAAKRLVKA
jgi:hypothetical protein